MYNGLLKSLKKNEDGFTLALVLVVLSALLILAGTMSYISVRTSRAAIDDRSLVQARCAADTGIERARLYLSADPSLRGNIITNYKVDDTSVVEKVTVADDDRTPSDPDVVKVTSIGKCRDFEKTVTAYMRMGKGTLFNLFRPGMTQIGAGKMDFSGNAHINSDIYANGYVIPNHNGINGTVYAVDPLTHIPTPNWNGVFPQISDINNLIVSAGNIAQAMGNYYDSSQTFDVSNLKEGFYFVNGDVTINGGSTNNKICIVATGNINVNKVPLYASNLSLLTKGTIKFDAGNGDYKIALGVASDSIDFSGPGGGNSSLTYGALVANNTVNGGFLRGNVTLTQDNNVDFNTIPAPGHTTKIISRTEK
ncbi:hypothetical protein ACETAC_04015 [Aceticella autotrophica]|uniref:Type 4 fimbrial biogenesis protein PilX N-terminal domain-containing protein n=1 Tax=Aceticella autotrophica TaxID=2755338 RepID=A0A975GBC7_9THEO|nr:hypothetical protein [Aceticella autotrophica]QSZ28032.1 hypothetical protein ACETAC_04015 [Aceticella autotrophica]